MSCMWVRQAKKLSVYRNLTIKYWELNMEDNHAYLGEGGTMPKNRLFLYDYPKCLLKVTD